MYLYGVLLREHGVMPSVVDNEYVEDFYIAMLSEEPKKVSCIDEVEGW